MRCLLVVCLLLVGCTHPEPRDYKPLVAAAIGAAAVQTDVPAPVPDEPEDEQCPNCEGTGKLGDNSGVVIDCPVCEGTGKLTKSEARVTKLLLDLKEDINDELAKTQEIAAQAPAPPDYPTPEAIADAVVARLKAEYGEVALAMVGDHASAFVADYSKALAIAEALGRPVLVVFSSKTCGPCRELERIQAKNLKWLAERFVLCRVYVQDEPELFAAKNVSTFPTQIVVRDGVEQDRKVGLPRGTYWEWLEGNK